MCRDAAQRLLIRGHKFRRPGQAGQGGAATLTAEIEPRVAFAVNEAMSVFGRLHSSTLSHSLTSAAKSNGGLLKSRTIEPSVRTSARRTFRPALSRGLEGLGDVALFECLRAA